MRKRARGRGHLAAIVVAVLVASGLIVALPPAPQAQAAAFATGGSGEHRGDILWLTWGTGQNGTPNQNLGNGASSSATIDIGEGQSLVTTCTLGSVSVSAGTIQSYKPGTWTGDYFDNLYNIGGAGGSNQLIAGISNSTDGATANFRITCTATLNGMPFELPGMVFADAERADPNEYVQGTGVGQFSLIERARACTQAYGLGSVTRNGDSETMRLSGTTGVNNPCAGPTAVSYLNFADSAYAAGNRAVSMDFQFYGSGKSAIAIGIIAPFDVGDAPTTYTRAIHVITPTASPVLGPRPATSYWNLPLATLGLPALRLGSLLDADGALVGDANANQDDITGIDDEDGVTTPAVMNAGTTVQRRSPSATRATRR